MSLCLSVQGSAVSHTSDVRQTEVVVIWNAPTDAPSHVQFLWVDFSLNANLKQEATSDDNCLSGYVEKILYQWHTALSVTSNVS